MKKQIKLICVSKILHRVIFDWFILILLLALSNNVSLFFEETNDSSRPRTGFLCGDQSLSYPYRPNTVSRSALYHIAQHIPLLSIFVVEIINSCNKIKETSNISANVNSIPRNTVHKDNDRHDYNCHGNSISNPSSSSSPSQRQVTRQHYILRRFSYFVFSFLQMIYQPLSCFLFGYAAERLFRSISKHCFPRLRPHFFAVCQPQLLGGGGNACSGNFTLQQHYVTEYECLTNSTYVVGNNGMIARTREMLRGLDSSFPSGHASFTCFSMIFMILYLQQRLVWPRTRLLRPTLQLCCFLVVWYVPLSRIWDNMHHAWDVAVGMALGTTIAIIVVQFVGLNFTASSALSSSSQGTKHGEEIWRGHTNDDLIQRTSKSGARKIHLTER